MTEIEITEIPPLEPHEQSLLDMHTVLNVLNVLRGELVLIGLALAGDDALLVRGLAVCKAWIASLHDPAAALEAARQVEVHAATIFAEIEATLAARPERSSDPEIEESRANLDSVFAILRVRALELLARAREPGGWQEFSLAALRQDFLEVFAAFERNSRGRFRIIYNAALQQPRDYYVDFKIESSTGDRLRMPAAFQDVLRDLIANARKYTRPGGRITAAIHEDPQALRMVVEDNGRGIPTGEMHSVVHFGQRASNVGDVRTMGGGFGLTKAFLVTKRFGGRLWIASELGAGTRVRIHLPRPAADLLAAGQSR